MARPSHCNRGQEVPLQSLACIAAIPRTWDVQRFPEGSDSSQGGMTHSIAIDQFGVSLSSFCS